MKKKKIFKLLKYILLLSLEVLFIFSWTVLTDNKILGFVSSCLFIHYISKISDAFKNIELFDRLMNEEIIFFATITTSIKGKDKECKCVGFVEIKETNKEQIQHCKCDFTIIKSVKNRRYMGFYEIIDKDND